MKDFFKTNWKECVITVLFFICLVLAMSTTCTNQKKHQLETNIAALNDTVHTYQLKNGELMYEKQGYILEKEELQQYLDISKAEVKDLEKKLNSALATIAKLQGQIRIDTLIMHDSVTLVADTAYIHFNYADNWLKMDGTTIYRKPFSCTTLNHLTMDVPLKVGMSKDDKWFVTSDNPYVQFTQVEGVNLEKAKPKHWSLGFQFGVGGIIGWGISGGQDGIIRSGWVLGAGGYVGIGVTYKILEF